MHQGKSGCLSHRDAGRPDTDGNSQIVSVWTINMHGQTISISLNIPSPITPGSLQVINVAIATGRWTLFQMGYQYQGLGMCI